MRTRFSLPSRASHSAISLPLPSLTTNANQFVKPALMKGHLPELFRSPHSDRVAILDRRSGLYCAYSLEESIHQDGLTLQEAEEWVQGFRLINQHIGLKQALHIGFMLIASWGCAAYGIWGLIELLF